MEKQCLNCSRPIKGRSDKKFCDEACRNQHNNILNSDLTAYMRSVQNILRKNRRILVEILGENQKLKIPLKRLIDLGFKLDFLTQLHTTKSGSRYQYNFEYGVMILEDGTAQIVKKNLFVQ